MRAVGIACALALLTALILSVSAPAANQRVVRGAVVLAPRDAAGLQRFIAAVSDRGSPRYGHYLRPGAFAARFGPAPATVGAVTAQLRSAGLRIDSVSASRMLVRFSGEPSAMSSMARSGGAVSRGALGRDVVAVIGPGRGGLLRHGAIRHPDPAQVRRHPAARGGPFAHPSGSPRACRAAQTAALAADGLTDDQIAHAYGADGLYAAGDRGAGQHIALYENEPFARSDIRTFDTCFFGSRQAGAMQRRLHVFAVDGGQPAGPGSGEASLDVEDVSALAPGATIDVYEGPYTGANPNDYDSLDEYAAIVDADRDRIVSTSWGLCEQAVEKGQTGIQQAENVLFEQAAAQGQTVFSAAGDNGSDDCNTNSAPKPVKGQDPLSVDDPSSQPYVLAAGGTAIDDARLPPVEQVWNGGPLGGSGGGGISASWPMPAWQQAARVPGIARPGGTDYRNAAVVQRAFGYPAGFCATSSAAASAAAAGSAAAGSAAPVPCRLLPDVSAEADIYTGSISVYSASAAGSPFSKDGWSTAGGTSSAAPLWAATLALVSASPACASARFTSDGIGFAAPQLYALASDPVRYAASFHDITAGSNDVDGLGGARLFAAHRGFDLATGLGSPQLTGPGGTAGLAYYLCAGSGPRRPVVSRLSPSSGDVAGGQRITITGSGFASGLSVEVGGRRLAASSVTVLSPTSIAVTLPAASALAAPQAPAPQDGAGPANVIVVARDGRASAPGPTATFDYVDTTAGGPVATVDAIAPSGGLRSAPRPVAILGSGMRGATSVTFGGVPASRFTVRGDGRITVTPPPLSAATRCAPLPSTPAYEGESAANDVCQVHVQVLNAHGGSAAGTILAPYEGAMRTTALGVAKLPAGCGCEGVTAPDEYDYVPAPHITSVSTSQGPAHLASETGGAVITIRGQGLNPLVLDWADLGDPAKASSQDINYAYLSGTKIQLTAPPRSRTLHRVAVALSVKTLAGQSAPARALYAGVPRVTAVATRSPRRLHGVPGAPDGGGTPIRITGQGFAGQVAGPLLFVAGQGVSAATDYAYGVAGDSVIDTTTVSQTPAQVTVVACTVSGCSSPRSGGRLWLYAPGDPAVSSLSPASGPAGGGTRVAIRGFNLGCALRVHFGGAAATKLRQGDAALDCGSNVSLRAVAPPGSAGSRVPVTVQTVESYFAGRGRGSGAARFTYR